MSRRHIFVYTHWLGLPNPVLMGNLYSEQLRGKEVFSFEYAKDWLSSGYAQRLDPDLQLYSGPHYLNDEQKTNFGIFLDSSPDRWGRVLMKRRDAALARKENRPEQTLFETDYLLGVFDPYRIGALRFKEELSGPFLNDNKELATPPWTRIRELEEISLKIEDSSVNDNPEYLNWLNMLMAPGSSLGGARPKASVCDINNHLWIAKFPSIADQNDMGGWELVVNVLAQMSGINVAQGQMKKFSSPFNTYLTKRFDRTTQGERIHFASAMTLLGYTDGQNFTHGASYLELAEFIMTHGANVKKDLEELWRRIVFSIGVSNTDDHLRNHGFLLTQKGWILSPAYDINPNETGAGLSLNISATDNALDYHLAMDVHKYFRLDTRSATKIMDTIRHAVSKWKDIATQHNLSASEQAMKASAFRA